MDKVIRSEGYKSKSMRFKSVLVGMFSALCFAYGSASADEVGAYWPPSEESFTENHIAINHIGSAMRYQGSDAMYITSLYTQDAFPNTAVLLSNDGSKELQIIVMDDSLSHRRFQRVLKNDLIITLDDEEFAKLQPDIKKMLSALKGKYHIGTLITLSYDSLRDMTSVKIDNETKGHINGKNIFNAMLKTMAGERPPSRDFKDSLLGFKAPVIEMTEQQEVLLTQYMSHKLNDYDFTDKSQQELAVHDASLLPY